MDYQNRAGSKKGSGGIASSSQENLHRRKQVEDLLSGGQEVPYSFQDAAKEEDEHAKKNPYIYRNHAGRLVCKLCNTMHMSWSSVERHVSGKKHGLNVLRRGGSTHMAQQSEISEEESLFQQKVEAVRSELRNLGIMPHYQVSKVKAPNTGHLGLAMKVTYPPIEFRFDNDDKPCARVMTSFEIAEENDDDKKYLVIAYEPYETIAVEIPNQEVVLDESSPTTEFAVDDFNSRSTYWDKDEKIFYVQLFFK